MKKSIYIAAFAALALTSCSNTEDQIFDQSAAERLDQYKKEYTETLTDGGGLWSMEYFSNEEEPGYVFVMKFDKNSSVTIYANHKWIGNNFKEETSIWKMIADNGPVLSFNSYNSLFHIFSDPANITGPNAPMGENNDDINETGYGHDGDYEFQVMEVSEDGNDMKLLGKKHMHHIYMRRLAPDTDIKDYLDKVSKVPNRFSSKFNELELIDNDGNHFRAYNMHTGIPSIFPLDGDEVMQTVTGNGIFTLDGFRFMDPLEVTRADGSSFEIDKLYFTEEGAMQGENVSDLRSISSLQNVVREDMTWTIDTESLSGKVKTLYDEANAAIVAALSAKDALGNIELTYGLVSGVSTPQLVTRLGTRICRNYIEYTAPVDENTGRVIPSDQLHFAIVGANNTANRYDSEIPAYKVFKDYLCGNFTMTVNNPLVPDVITVIDNNDSSSSFKLKAK